MALFIDGQLALRKTEITLKCTINTPNPWALFISLCFVFIPINMARRNLGLSFFDGPSWKQERTVDQTVELVGS